jgi:hypothetical protein
MAALDEAARIALGLPEVHEGRRYGNRAWFVGRACFVWERPLSKADLKRLGDAPVPPGALLGVVMADLGEKEAVLAEGRTGVMTIAHFDGYPAVLLVLEQVGVEDLSELITDAWLCSAPAALVASFTQP